MSTGAQGRYLKSCITTTCKGRNNLSIHFISKVSCTKTNRLGHKASISFSHRRSTRYIDKIGIFYTSNNIRHFFDYLYWIFPSRGLRRKHYSISSINNRVSHIIYLSTSRCKTLYHRFHHLGSYNHRDSGFFSLTN